jgi:glycosyltransferase involved in cell wall biosynthesis
MELTMRIIEHYRPAAIAPDRQTALLSVIVPAYNIEDYIERGVSSICHQTYRNLEIIVVDDGSTDRTGAVCDALAARDGRVHVIHKENEGPAQARNVGIAQAHGTYIGFVDGDDWIDPDMYEKLLGALWEYDADMAICRYRQVHKTYTEDQSRDRAVLFEDGEVLRYYIEETKEYSIQNAAWNKLYTREILKNVDFPAGKWYEDIMFATVALAQAKRCIYLDSACYNYIIDREGSIMNTQINPRTFTDQIPAYMEKTQFLQGLGRQDLADIHDCFFYKRLFLFYKEIKERKDFAQKRESLNKITDIIYSDPEHVKQVFRCSAATKKDRRQASLFLRSPEVYCRSVRWDERVVIPLKAAVKKILRVGSE